MNLQPQDQCGNLTWAAQTILGYIDNLYIEALNLDQIIRWWSQAFSTTIYQHSPTVPCSSPKMIITPPTQPSLEDLPPIWWPAGKCPWLSRWNITPIQHASSGVQFFSGIIIPQNLPNLTKMIQNDEHSPKWMSKIKMDQFTGRDVHIFQALTIPDLLLGLAQLDEATGQARLLVLPGWCSCSRLLEGVPRCWGWIKGLQGKDTPLQHETVELDQLQEASGPATRRMVTYGNCHSELRVDVDLESFVCWHSFTGALCHYAVYKRNESRNIFYPSSFLSPFVIELAHHDNKCWVLL